MGPSIPSPPMLDTLLGHSACQWKFLLHVSIIFTNPSRFRNTRTNFQNTPLCLAKNLVCFCNPSIFEYRRYFNRSCCLWCTGTIS